MPPLNEDADPKNLTIREKFAKHRENPGFAGCHSASIHWGLRWRISTSPASGVTSITIAQWTQQRARKYPFADPAKFKQSIVQEDKRFTKAFTSHLLRFALARELSDPTLTVDQIVENTAKDNFKLFPSSAK